MLPQHCCLREKLNACGKRKRMGRQIRRLILLILQCKRCVKQGGVSALANNKPSRQARLRSLRKRPLNGFKHALVRDHSTCHNSMKACPIQPAPLMFHSAARLFVTPCLRVSKQLSLRGGLKLPEPLTHDRKHAPS